MIFIVRQIIEKCHEHRSKAFLVFVDLRKAYDSMPRAALWLVLRKLGVPDHLVQLLQSFHDNMTATIIVNGSPADAIPVCNGLRQGGTMAPGLFNLFAAAVMERRADRIREHGLCGLPLRCRVDGQLFKCLSKGGTDCSVKDGEFADDAVLFATTHCDAQDMLAEFVDVAGAFGLTVNMVKTLFMAVGYGVTDNDRSSLVIRNAQVQHTARFPYLGSIVSSDGRCHADVCNRIAAAS